MPISKKASLRRTWPKREAASTQAAAATVRSQEAASISAKQTQNARHVAKSGTGVVRAHTQARGQRNQARRDSR